MNQRLLSFIPFLAFAGVMAFTAYLCITVQGNYAVNGNISWLLMGAERLLQGQTMGEHIYEPNPPLSLIIYIPHVLFSRLIGMSLPEGSFYVTGIFVLLSLLAVYHITKRLSFLNKAEKMGFLACYTIAVTLTTVIFYSEREHIMILALAPFMLAQFALMERITLPKRLSIPVFLIGALGVMIKPHYGLAPTIFLLTRMIKHKTINPLKAPDFLALSIVTLLYISFVIIVFSDYTQIIFFDFINFYIGTGFDLPVVLQTSRLLALLYLSTFIIELFQSDQPGPRRRMILYLYLCCLLSMMPYYIQMKGYYNHLIPANSFFMMAICASIMLRIGPLMSEKLKRGATLTATISILVPYLCVLLVSHALIPLNNEFPTHKDMRELPVAKFLEERCEQPCSFYVFHTDIEIMPSTAAIMDYEFASRFCTFWPMPELVKNLQSDDPQIRKNALKAKEKYSRYILEDMQYHKPSLLITLKEILVPTSDVPIDFMKFFGEYKPLRNYIKKHYTQDRDFEFDRSVYFKGTTMEYPFTIYYDVYTRKNQE